MTGQASEPIAKSTSWFNLRLALACAVVMWLAWSHYRTRELLRYREKEVDYWRSISEEQANYGGHFTVEDRNKVAVGLIRTDWREQVAWRWRVYLPPGRRFSFFYGLDSILESDFPSPKIPISDVIKSDPENGSSIVIEVVFWRDASGEERMDICLPGQDQTASTNIPEHHALHSHWYRSVSWNTSISGEKAPRVFARDEPIELIRMRHDGKDAVEAGKKLPRPNQGLLIWIEELEQSR